MTEDRDKGIWCLLEEASSHLQDDLPPDGCWEHPEDVEKVRGWVRGHADQIQEGDGGEWPTPMHLAAYYMLPDLAKVLLQAGADPNAPSAGVGWTPLHQAVSRSQDDERDLHFIRVLLDHGGRPDLPDRQGRTPLDYAWGRTAALLRGRCGRLDLNTACRLGAVEDVKRTLAADPHAVQNAPDPTRLISDAVGCYGGTKEAEALEIIGLLLRHGANVNAPDSEQGTPLYYACGGGSPASIIRLLLLHGADVTATSRNGETPLDIARKCKRDDVVEMLLHAGAGRKLR